MTTSTTALAPLALIPPVLPSWNPLGHLFNFRDDPLALFERGRDMGDAVRMRVAGRYLTAVYHPDAIHRVLVERQPNYVKQTRGYQQLRKLLGNGLLTAEGDLWKRNRRIAQPAFQHRRIAGFADVMMRATNDLATQWEAAARTGEVVDIAESMNQLTLRIAGETLFSIDISGESDTVGGALSDMLGGFLPSVTNPLLAYLPVPSTLRYRRGKATLDKVVHGIIARRRQEPEHQDDLLGMFMAARDEDGHGMSDEQLRDEVLTMLLAGHETTANALAWTFAHLSQNPEAAAPLYDEVDRVFGNGTFTLEAYPLLTYADQVIKESMRLSPPAWVESRMAVEDDELCGYRIPAGSFVFMSQYAMHRHPKYWVNPTTFDPTRFGPGAHLCPDGSPRPKGVYFPFSDGQRKCIGEHFANMEARIVLTMLTRRFRATLVPGTVLRQEPSVTLRPGGGVPVRLEVRQ